MRTFKQWCEQLQKDDLADDIAKTTQASIQAGRDPKPELQKLLAKKSMEAQAQGDAHKAASVAGAVSKIQPADPTKPKMKKK